MKKTKKKAPKKKATEKTHKVSRVRENPHIPGGVSYDLWGEAEPPPPPRKRGEYSRPRVKISGGTILFKDRSPWKGKIVRANPTAALLLRPVRVELTADEAAAIMAGNAAAIRELRAGAGRARRDWDHLEAHDSRGTHLFDLVR